jgi:hypothetical protein
MHETEKTENCCEHMGGKCELVLISEKRKTRNIIDKIILWGIPREVLEATYYCRVCNSTTRYFPPWGDE